MNTREILATKTIEKNGFEFKLDLVSYVDCGMTCFSDKWIVDSDGPVIGKYDNFNCDWYTIGEDCTVEQAQEEFDRDVEAYDVHLFITVSKNGIELINDPVVGSDYHWSEDSELLLNDLMSHVDFEDYVIQAKTELNVMIEALTK